MRAAAGACAKTAAACRCLHKQHQISPLNHNAKCQPPRERTTSCSYRLGLTATAAAVGGGAAAGLSGGLDSALDPLCALGAAGLGVSVFLIHVYVTPLKRFLQVRPGDC